MQLLISVLALMVLPFCRACSNDLTAPMGTFTSPNYPSNYPPSKECITKITAAAGKIIKLKFTTFSLEDGGCYFDWVEITDGPTKKKMCGKTIPPEFVSKSNVIQVKFKSDSVIEKKGFSASYITTDAPPPLPPATVNGQNCGKTTIAQSRVIGGNNATKGAWPWQVGLYTKYGTFFCGGSLIAPNWVVTAAHCLEGSSPSSLTVKVGDHDNSAKDGTEQEVGVEKVISHPRYNIAQSSSGCVYHAINNDVGLLKLAAPVRLNAYVNTVCLPSQSKAVVVGTKCFITGWGKIKHPGDTHRFLQQAMLPIVDTQICQTKLDKSGIRMKISKEMVCAGEEGSRKSGCHGDSGGPLVCMDAATNKYHLQGDVSWGSGRCDTSDTFSVFGRMSEFRNWIDEKLKAN